jgi:hypothetical protein
MHVGEQDASWLRAMQAEYTLLKQRGAHIQFAIEKEQGHRLDVTRDNLLNRLVAEIERARNGCA